MELYSDEYFMNKAYEQAEIAFDKNEVPVGVIIVSNNMIIAKGHNLTEQLQDVTAHAEMQAITSASEYLNGKFLENCTMYVTLEPCVMCAGALYWSRISKIVIGTKDEKRGASQQLNSPYHPSTEIITGIESQKCQKILQNFFQQKRKSS